MSDNKHDFEIRVSILPRSSEAVRIVLDGHNTYLTVSEAVKLMKMLESLLADRPEASK